MTVGSHQLAERFAIQPKAIFTTEFRQTNSDTGDSAIYGLIAFFKARLYSI